MRQIFFCVPTCYPSCNLPRAQGVTKIGIPYPRIRRQAMDAHPCHFCAGEVLGCSQPPGLFLGATALTFPLTSRHHGSKRPPSRGTGFLFPAGHSPKAEHTAATATQSRNPSRFSRASLSLPALANASGSGYKKRAGSAATPPARRDSSPEYLIPKFSAPVEVPAPTGAACYLRFNQ